MDHSVRWAIPRFQTQPRSIFVTMPEFLSKTIFCIISLVFLNISQSFGRKSSRPEISRNINVSQTQSWPFLLLAAARSLRTSDSSSFGNSLRQLGKISRLPQFLYSGGSIGVFDISKPGKIAAPKLIKAHKQPVSCLGSIFSRFSPRFVFFGSRILCLFSDWNPFNDHVLASAYVILHAWALRNDTI